MKILWFVNVPLPSMVGPMARGVPCSGSWTAALYEECCRKGMDLSVACVYPGLEPNSGAPHLICVRQGGKRTARYTLRDSDGNAKYLQACADICSKVQADVIHVHGTERFYGLLGARKMVDAPVVVSIQGLLHEFARWRNFSGAAPRSHIISCGGPAQLIEQMGRLYNYRRLLRAVAREREVIAGNRYFIGRTEWDRAHVLALNPKARYFEVWETLRKPFYAACWKQEACCRHRLLFTNGGTLSRGVEVLLTAGGLLRARYPDLRIIVAGGLLRRAYGRQLAAYAAQLGLADAVEFLDVLSAEQVRDELHKCHVFVQPSLLENSPNSLCEAQAIGVPCVASYAGGIPSLIVDRTSGLLFQPGDAAMLAARIREVFDDRRLADHLSEEARATAQRRHNPQTILAQTLAVYEAVAGRRNSRPSQQRG